MTEKTEGSVVICGLPASGKTTFLAALWFVVFDRRDPNARLKFDSLVGLDHSHLNAIMRRWLEAKEQIHTEVASGKIVSMNLNDGAGRKVRMTFPDLSGESYQQMWETRECDHQLAELLRGCDGILLFVHADKIKRPIGVAETTQYAAGLEGGAGAAGTPKEWHPKDAPTAVQLVEMLQMLRCDVLRAPASRLAVVLSAWDKVEEENVTPEQYLASELPLLDQYLRNGVDRWDVRVYGLSAQGGDFESDEAKGDADRNERVAMVRALDDASERIRLMTPELSRDLTEPVAWLTE
ncbi:hypothetical protein JJB98_03780 [Bradyrhizobium diazoefficiens]|nr:hypothetical protein [Bradyrhizobium diazoefficiens]QQO19093.1 hypothetical protein JJB98_03780 [Bradyrhizobium diazoefficiens]